MIAKMLTLLLMHFVSQVLYLRQMKEIITLVSPLAKCHWQIKGRKGMKKQLNLMIMICQVQALCATKLIIIIKKC